MKYAPLFALALSLSLALPTQRVLAFPRLAGNLPNTASAPTSFGAPAACITCHSHPDGGRACEPESAFPCLNSFGDAFVASSFLWTVALAEQDSDGDGFTNGQELQDPTGTWLPTDPTPGNPLQTSQPGSSDSSPGQNDLDGDGYCWFGQDLDASGDCLGDGENNGELDCDDTIESIHSGADEVCADPSDGDCNGLPTLLDSACVLVVDRDRDGFCFIGEDRNRDQDCTDSGEAVASSDCDDTLATVFPGARENCIDGLDNNCDGDTDRSDATCNGEMDEDGDGFCPIGTDLNDDGDCLDAGEADAGYDCDDGTLFVGILQPEVCGDDADYNCDGRVDVLDPECAPLFDADADGFCEEGRDGNSDGDCTDEGEQDGTIDCDDADPTVNAGVAELCTNMRDDNCNGETDLEDIGCASFLDQDGDGYCGAGRDTNDDADCVDRGESSEDMFDCDDMNPDASPEFEEMCLNGFDDNCDGLSDGRDALCEEDYFDFDGDGYCLGGQDLDASGTCDGTGEQGTPGDADNMDPYVYPGAPEYCFDERDNDQDGDVDGADSACTGDMDSDGDGYCPVGQDMNGDGDCSDDGEVTATGDCDDENPQRNPAAVERCRGTIADLDCDQLRGAEDSDCSEILDQDGDGFCEDGIDDNGDGDCLDPKEDRFGVDCDDSDATTSPRSPEICDDGVDNDCDMRIDVYDSQCPCLDDSLCDDGDPCTVDACDELARNCVVEPLNTCLDAGTRSDAGELLDGGGTDSTPSGPMASEPSCACSVSAGSVLPSPMLVGFVLFVFLMRRRR